jgi:2-hydroxy-3-keto-5-methylthiopentenyl-1-phosphate phosphatase
MAKNPNGSAGDDLLAATKELAVKTLTGDLRDFILDRMRHEHDARPWNKRGENEQRDTVNRVQDAVRAAVTRVVELIASQGHHAMSAVLTQITVKDGFKAVLEMSKHDPLRHQFVDAQGATVLVVMADIDEFVGERAPVKITPDQSKLAIDPALAVQHSEADSAREQAH